MAPRRPKSRGALDETGRRLRRAVLEKRFENNLARQIDAEVARFFDRLAALLAEMSPADVSAGRRATRIASLAKRAEELLRDAYANLNAISRDELVGLAKVSARASVGEVLVAADAGPALVASAMQRLPAASTLRALVTNVPVQGETLYKWWRRQATTTRLSFLREVQIGVARGEGTQDLIRRIRGTRVGSRVVGGVMQTSRRNAEALVRTAVNQISNEAAVAAYRENPRLVAEVEFVATLDQRTTEICASLDGNVYRIDDPSLPRPPLHFNCRSTLVPRVNYDGLGLEAPKEAPRETYPDWWDRQSREVQDLTVGPARAELLRSGKVGWPDLVRSDGRSATLDEIARKLED